MGRVYKPEELGDMLLNRLEGFIHQESNFLQADNMQAVVLTGPLSAGIVGVEVPAGVVELFDVSDDDYGLEGARMEELQQLHLNAPQNGGPGRVSVSRVIYRNVLDIAPPINGICIWKRSSDINVSKVVNPPELRKYIRVDRPCFQSDFADWSNLAELDLARATDIHRTSNNLAAIRDIKLNNEEQERMGDTIMWVAQAIEKMLRHLLWLSYYGSDRVNALHATNVATQVALCWIELLPEEASHLRWLDMFVNLYGMTDVTSGEFAPNVERLLLTERLYAEISQRVSDWERECVAYAEVFRAKVEAK